MQDRGHRRRQPDQGEDVVNDVDIERQGGRLKDEVLVGPAGVCCVRVCVCVCVCVCVNMMISRSIYIYLPIYIYIYIYISLSIYLYLSIYLSVSRDHHVY